MQLRFLIQDSWWRISCAHIVYLDIDDYIVSMAESILKLKLWLSPVEDKASEWCLRFSVRRATSTQHLIECDLKSCPSVVLAGRVWHDSACWQQYCVAYGVQCMCWLGWVVLPSPSQDVLVTLLVPKKVAGSLQFYGVVSATLTGQFVTR